MAASKGLPDKSVIAAVWSRAANVEVERGEGSWLIDRDGERWLDYTSGIGVVNTGHAHPKVAAAIAAQATKLIHGQQNIVYHEPGLRLHDRLSRVLDGGPWGVFLSNSGSEAVEAAVKLARRATKRRVILTFRGGYHGRTAQTMAMTTAKNVYRGHFEPLPGSVYSTAFPSCFRAPVAARDASAAGNSGSCAGCSCRWEDEWDLTLHTIADAEDVAAVIVEPILGEGGYVVPPAGFLPRLRELTRERGILLIADEIQTGMGRTGRMFAVQHQGVEPDILVFAKGIASGLPLSGIIARRDLIETWAPGTHGGTYGGNVIACAAALATLDVMEEERLTENAAERGAKFLAGLRALAQGRPAIGDVRGLGLMIALEFVKPGEGDGRVPNPDAVKRVIAEANKRKLLLLSAGSYAQVIRIIPPLVTTAAEVDLALKILDESLDAAGVKRA
ncbi:MAG: aspartate aminotransferase family protein [Chloroflexi bacterium]|nr:MAG: aspartate aminotransferase family protein [Chloroflexota bacterium]RLT29290.1 MAG: aspartate aminotransferase family protein [Chloroflexota bacterium]